MRRIFQFDGLGSGILSVGECAEPGQVLLHIEREGATADVRLTRDEWRDLMALNHTITIRYEESTDQRLSAVLRPESTGMVPPCPLLSIPSKEN